MKAPNPTPVLLAVAAALVLTLPAAAGQAASPEPTREPAPADAVQDQDAAEPAGEAGTCGVAAALAEDPLLQSSVGAASSCTAETTCLDGKTISCSGDSCFTDPRCFVVCDGNMIRCASACP